MKLEQEIKEKLEIYKKIKEKAAIFTSEFELPVVQLLLLNGYWRSKNGRN